MSLSSEKSYLSENLNLQSHVKSLRVDLQDNLGLISKLKSQKSDFLEQISQLEAEFANEFCNIVIIISPGAKKFTNSTPFTVSIDLPNARLKTAKKSNELTAGPTIV